MSNNLKESTVLVAVDNENCTWRIMNPNGEIWKVLIPVEKPFDADTPFGLNLVTKEHYE